MSAVRMNGPVAFEVGPLLRGEVSVVAEWVSSRTMVCLWRPVIAIVIGAGAYGAAMGSWRAPEQAFASGIKLPLVLIATAAGNALINGMLAPLLGVNLQLRESFAAVLTSFALAAVILGGLSPLMLFVVWNLPAPQIGVPMSVAARSVMLLAFVGTIAFAGVAANVRLLQLLRQYAGQSAPALRLLFAWLAVNLLLGSQVSWVARPFIGKAHVPVVFLEEQPLRGRFFEELFQAGGDLWHSLLDH